MFQTSPCKKSKKKQNEGNGEIAADESHSNSFSSYGRRNQPSIRNTKSFTIARPPFSLLDVTSKNISKDSIFNEGFSSVIKLLLGRKNVVVLVGAGISVSSGIPDFRSKETGLYSTLNLHELGLSSPEDLFDLEVFQDDPRPFYKFASKMLYPSKPLKPSACHRFLAMLEEKKMLRRVYTQNIDGLEAVAGVSPKRIVHAHGSLGWAQCLKCRTKVDASIIKKEIKEGKIPLCTKPSVKRQKRKLSLTSRTTCITSIENLDRERRPKRRLCRGVESRGEEDIDYVCSDRQDMNLCNGVMKPGITFFGEKLGDKVRRCLQADRLKADALIVIGTSLSVMPMSKVIGYLSPLIPRILINRNIVTPANPTIEELKNKGEGEVDFRNGYVFDACLLGFCDDVTRLIVKAMNNAKDGEIALPTVEGNILCNSASDESSYLNDLCNHPKDRIFLFPGAVIDNQADSDPLPDIILKEVARCDSCHCHIEDTIMKCTDCFDYDLCVECYPKLSKTHFDGVHKFVTEK